ncbi:hypothetical protein BABINDRAFT_162882, partial [Babjeviella inositovora NRRL Y-12698]
MAELQDQYKALEEDDEFEDFPVDNWDDEQTISKDQQNQLWNEDWDDDDNHDDFSQKLKYVTNKNLANPWY